MNTPTPRQEALQKIDMEVPSDIPTVAPYISAPESQQAFLERIKPERYVVLAQVIDSMLKHTREDREERSGDGVLESPHIGWDADPWRQLSADFSYTMGSAIDNLRACPEFKAADAYAKLISTTDDPARHFDAEIQLRSGIDTATGAMTALLKNVPAIVDYHKAEIDQAEFPALAKNSLNLVGRLAVTCVNRLMAAREGLASPGNRWSGEITELDPAAFEIKQRLSGQHSLHYADFDSIVIPRDSQPFLRGIPAGSTEVTVNDVSCSHAATVGCPVTLLPGRMRELWNWHIDVVESRGLWTMFDDKKPASELD